ncbi:MAG: efflux RND transporter periplasmic adaptor subunit [Rhizomicrobium sp.]|jgi:cobalt-zinc-cadmium efflux system membrane fusion protein
MTAFMKSLRRQLAQIARWFSAAEGDLGSAVRKYFAVGVVSHAPANANLVRPPYTPGRLSLPAIAQWRIVGALGGAALVLVLLAWGVSALFSGHAVSTDESNGSGAASTTFQPTPEQLAGIVIKPVHAKIFPAVTSTEGNIASDDDLTTPVFSPFTGRVTQLIAKLGDQVKKGQPLMVVEASEFVQAQNDLITAVSGLHSATAQLNLAETNEKREHQLFDARGAALKDWQQSQSDLATAQGNYRTAMIALAAVRNRLRIFGKSDSEIAAMERAPIGRQTSPDAIVAAPIDGTVILRQVGVGQFIQSGASNPIYSISNLSTVWLVANVREVDAPYIKLGDPVNVRVLAVPNRIFRAKITYVAPSIDPATHRLQVRADVDNPDGVLKPQMFAAFNIITGQDEAAPAVPQSAIVYEGETARVWVQEKDGRLGLRIIRIGRSDGDDMEALSGLRAGEKIVTGGAIFIDRAASGASD